LVLAVPDDAILPAARKLARLGFRCPFAMHLSGALDASSELAPLRNTGTRVLSFHPLRSFAGRRGENLRGCPIAIEGDAEAVRLGEALARAMGARPWKIRRAAKPAYHAAAALTAGGTATLVAAAAREAERAGLSRRQALAAFAELAAGAAENIGACGFPAGLTGPFKRRDRVTAGKHRRALRQNRRLRLLYDHFARLVRRLQAAVRPPGGH
jgi:predicted short-subunit dehydrogenase-like oxidoreductase (DUF2520 family)